mmetsp:Transcript_784/g.1217  ORF Transcript_784/g.1217 Transcript_784/m.1217 type:complete len:220 (+) Transcript_784:20-679(+)
MNIFKVYLLGYLKTFTVLFNNTEAISENIIQDRIWLKKLLFSCLSIRLALLYNIQFKGSYSTIVNLIYRLYRIVFDPLIILIAFDIGTMIAPFFDLIFVEYFTMRTVFSLIPWLYFSHTLLYTSSELYQFHWMIYVVLYEISIQFFGGKQWIPLALFIPSLLFLSLIEYLQYSGAISKDGQEPEERAPLIIILYRLATICFITILIYLFKSVSHEDLKV